MANWQTAQHLVQRIVNRECGTNLEVSRTDDRMVVTGSHYEVGKASVELTRDEQWVMAQVIFTARSATLILIAA